MNRPLPSGWEKPWNQYLRRLCQSSFTDWDQPRVEGNIMITPDGFRWRIEEEMRRVGDVVHAGDHIRSYYGSGTVMHVMRCDECCCPFRDFFFKICQGAGARRDLHLPVVWWNIQYVPDRIDGKVYNILEVVFFEGKIVNLFENAAMEEVIVDGAGKGDFQLQMW